MVPHPHPMSAEAGDLAASCPALCGKGPPWSLAGLGSKVASMNKVPSAVRGGPAVSQMARLLDELLINWYPQWNGVHSRWDTRLDQSLQGRALPSRKAKQGQALPMDPSQDILKAPVGLLS
ncbi:solute carrier family 10 member 3 [Rhinolophus ferrumequinum]|uniref:Solute carrier family 10 member 3 n=1 Tax=Rhinolophus ferrumequinum TaxID=59479 RepID=A0A7J8AW95_RHIFE|nr:solute carrier family 10 member 3 [Rhinolophus ferrumequinum]